MLLANWNKISKKWWLQFSFQNWHKISYCFGSQKVGKVGGFEQKIGKSRNKTEKVGKVGKSRKK